jgi:hypothetical protein
MRILRAKRLTGSAAAVAVAVHLLVGCCAHHSHAACAACETQGEDTACAKPWHTEDEACHTDHAGAKQWHLGKDTACAKPWHTGPKHDHRCDAGRCVFVGPGEGSGARVGVVSFDAFPPAFLPPSVAPDRSRDSAPVWNCAGWGPIRLHLLKRVLLV